MTKRVKVHIQRWWKARLDPAMSKLIRKKGFCERCGRINTSLDWSHVVGRKNLTLRWDILNALCLCFQCHRYFWHEEPLDSVEWFKIKFPQRWVYLSENKDKVIKRTEEDYKKLLRDIKENNLKALVVFGA